MTTTDIKKFVKRHRLVIFGGTMLVAGIIIGRRMDISYDRVIDKGFDMLDRVSVDVSTEDGCAVDIIMGKAGEKRCAAFGLTKEDAIGLVKDINDVLKEVESVQA